MFGKISGVFMTEIKETRNIKPFGIRDKIGYLLGDLGNDFTFILSSSFLLKFYTDVMGLSAGTVGIIMMLSRFLDAVTDVTMGRICDRSKSTRHGKFKPWLLRMAGPVAIFSFLIYQSSFADRSIAFKTVWLAITYILWGSVFYTSVNIPYGSMVSVITDDPHHRQSLSTWRSMGATLAGAIIGAGVPLLVYKQREIDGQAVAILDGKIFTSVAGVLSLLSVGAYILCFFLTTERVKIDSDKAAEHRSIGALISSAFRNRALVSMVTASVVMLMAQLTMQQMANYVFPNYYGNYGAMTVSTLAMLLAMILAAAFAKPLARKVGKAEISAAANLLAAAVSASLFFIRPVSVWVFVGLQLIMWLGLGLFTMVSWALITDVIDHSELINGVREDGSIYAMYSFARKLGQSLSAGFVGLLLTVIGYSEQTAFSPSVKEGIFNIATLVPAVGFLILALILWFWYPLHKKVVEKNTAVLKEKRG